MSIIQEQQSVDCCPDKTLSKYRGLGERSSGLLAVLIDRSDASSQSVCLGQSLHQAEMLMFVFTKIDCPTDVYHLA